MGSIIKRVIYLGSIAFFSVSHLYPCAITVINNSAFKKVILVDKDASISMIVDQNSTPPAFGNPNKRAHFTVLVPDDAQAADPKNFVASVVVRQIACTASHAITVYVADLLNKKADTAIFEVTDYLQKHKVERMHEQEQESMQMLASWLKKPAAVSLILAQQQGYDPEPRTTGFIETSAQTRETSGNIPYTENLTDEYGVDVTPSRNKKNKPSCCEED